MAWEKNPLRGDKMREYQNNVSKSIALWEQCKNVIPAGSSTLAKSPVRLSYGYSPFYAERAAGSHFWDVDGNDWLDCEMSMGTVVWGHSRAEVNAAMAEQIQRGVHFSVPSTLEYQLANCLLSRFAQYNAAKFFTNGADAVYSCVRAARFLSNRTMTISCEYHGWLDWSSPTYYRCPPSQLGIPDETLAHHISCYEGVSNILEQINENHDRLAAVVLCPANYDRELLRQLLAVCSAHGIFTIFDEVTSGIRFAKGGATSAFNLQPDFLCLSKGLTNGLPLAAALGSQENILVMEQLKISSAHAGNNLSLAAALACEKLLAGTAIWPSWQPQTDRLLKRISAALADMPPNIQLVLSGSTGCFSITTPNTDFIQDPFRLFMMKYLAERHIFSKGYILFSDAHTEEEINYVEECLMKCIQRYANINS